MFSKISILFVILIHYTYGSPLEPRQDKYNVKEFLSSRIVGGEDAPEGYAPHMASLVMVGWIKSLVCGGSIISESLILTAAHCIEPFIHEGKVLPHFQAVIGSNYWNDTNLVEFKGYVIHSEWDWYNIKNDIGMLITKEKMIFSERVRPIRLNYDVIGGGVHSYVAGWGLLEAWGRLPYRLQLLYVSIISHKECAKRVKKATETLGSAPPVDPDIEICTYHSKGHGMCNGDSGSALVLAGSREQVGIVSWAFPCALGAPDVYVRVSGFKEFILDVVRKHGH